jgi:DNA invertase Pin-like site-specific DNA recombinase
MQKAAVWMRVSDGEQDAGNQEAAIEQFAAHHGYEIAKRYRVDGWSAWNVKDDGAYRKTLQQALRDAWLGEFQVIIVWALDRITREGAEGALRVIRQFRERHVTLVSVQEPWLSASAEVQDLLVAFAGWMAEQESKRRSERIKAGIARAKAEGKPVGGRKAGARDRKPRRRDGYAAGWDKRRAQAAGQAARDAA